MDVESTLPTRVSTEGHETLEFSNVSGLAVTGWGSSWCMGVFHAVFSAENSSRT